MAEVIDAAGQRECLLGGGDRCGAGTVLDGGVPGVVEGPPRLVRNMRPPGPVP